MLNIAIYHISPMIPVSRKIKDTLIPKNDKT
jgi:hypothetical protein